MNPEKIIAAGVDTDEEAARLTRQAWTPLALQLIATHRLNGQLTILSKEQAEIALACGDKLEVYDRSQAHKSSGPCFSNTRHGIRPGWTDDY